ncbi:hypothetical protein SCFA_250011 [anaerobic digester metagenome]|uniref:Transposase n=1 Tax=anaerobic digester metagenome TaxID=1263854 RepID=A0A485M4V8_9ZZZZ
MDEAGILRMVNDGQEAGGRNIGSPARYTGIEKNTWNIQIKESNSYLVKRKRGYIKGLP